MLQKIISGGQTGVDRAALDSALARGVETGGWCPRGRRSDDGTISWRYPLQETPTSDYRQRTHWNMRDCDGALILHRGRLTGGTLLTVQLARNMKKLHRLINLNRNADLIELREWLVKNRIRVLNVAGPRERGNPGIHDQAFAFMRALMGDEPIWMAADSLRVTAPF